MTPEEHIATIAADFKREATMKYMKGVQEHGEGLRQVPSLKLVEYAMEEAMDEYIYLHTLREQLLLNRQVDITPISLQQQIDGYRASQVSINGQDFVGTQAV